MVIYLTQEQKSWIARNFTKIAQGVEDKKRSKDIERIAKKCLEAKKTVSFNKLEAKAVLQASELAVNVLGKTLEKYNEDPSKYKEYIEKASEKKIVLEKLVKKVKGKLR